MKTPTIRLIPCRYFGEQIRQTNDNVLNYPVIAKVDFKSSTETYIATKGQITRTLNQLCTWSVDKWNIWRYGLNKPNSSVDYDGLTFYDRDSVTDFYTCFVSEKEVFFRKVDKK